MNRDEIQAGHCYRIRKHDLAERRVLVDWGCPADDPTWYCCWDLETGHLLVLLAQDFLEPCDESVSWEELLHIGPEHRG